MRDWKNTYANYQQLDNCSYFYFQLFQLKMLYLSKPEDILPSILKEEAVHKCISLEKIWKNISR